MKPPFKFFGTIAILLTTMACKSAGENQNATEGETYPETTQMATDSVNPSTSGNPAMTDTTATDNR